MFEKVNPCHPDKVADRIAGAMVDLAYSKQENPKIAVEVLIGHNKCYIIAETTISLDYEEVKNIVKRISGLNDVEYREVPQDVHLNNNQKEKVRCGDNGIFKGVPISTEETKLTDIAKYIYYKYRSDGKYIINDNGLIICQSKAKEELQESFPNDVVNPLGYWDGGLDVDTGATNRKLGSDMGRAVTGGGLHGKDLSKADVSVNIYAHLMAQLLGKEVSYCCAIGDDKIDGKDYEEIIKIAKNYIDNIGGFEKLAEWGLIR